MGKSEVDYRLMFRKFIEEKTGTIPKKDWSLYEQNLIYTTAKRGDTIFKQNKICTTVWHMISGAVRKDEMNNGSSKTIQFCIAPKIFTLLESAATNLPSESSIICEEDCEFLVMSFDRLQKLFLRSHYIERIGRRVVEDILIEELALRRMLITLDAPGRYNYLERTMPQILSRFQLKHIATFLGVTPETLSRLRKTRTESQASHN